MLITLYIAAGLFDDPASVITTLALFAFGSGTAGMTGAWLSWRRFKLEQKQAKNQGTVALREVDVEQFKALFPGGLGDAVEHWREEAKDLYVEVDQLREDKRTLHRRVVELEAVNTRQESELDRRQARLDRFQTRIEQLQKELDQKGGS